MSNIPKIGKALKNLFINHDVSSFMSLVSASVLLEANIDTTSLNHIFIEELDLKTVYSIVESLISQCLLNAQNLPL